MKKKHNLEEAWVPKSQSGRQLTGDNCSGLYMDKEKWTKIGGLSIRAAKATFPNEEIGIWKLDVTIIEPLTLAQ